MIAAHHAGQVSAYLSRTLTTPISKNEKRCIDDGSLLSESGSVVILGDPGMGKTELMRELGRRLGIKPCTANRFMHSAAPAKLMSPGKPVLIDGLDEALARRDGDAIDKIIAKLDAADAPRFIMACRSKEWQGRHMNAMGEIYDDKITVFTLRPLTRDGAVEFLAGRYPAANPAGVLDHLAQYGLNALFENPLTLGMLGRIAETAEKLPESRAALFDRVLTLIWSEHDGNRQNDALWNLTEAQALDAAGAMSAALVLGGADAIADCGSSSVHDGAIQLAEVERLPGAEAARAMMSSKLFQSGDDARVSPIHRVVAEFLGAGWLARQAASPRVQRRLISHFQGQGPVPASLRGLHAWLAHHAPATLAEAVIRGDPYGMLLYGETGTLSPTLARCLFDALRALAEDDPLFRAGHWTVDSARALMRPTLQNDINDVIQSPDNHGHLRALLIDALKGTDLARDLASTLEAIALSPDRFYAERIGAIEALMPHRPRAWWRDQITDLLLQGPDDGSQLGLDIISLIDLDMDNNFLVEAIFAGLGATVCWVPRNTDPHSRIFFSLINIGKEISSDRICCILDLIADYSDLLDNADWEGWYDVAELVTTLIVRGIEAGLIGSAQASSVWRWLRALDRAGGSKWSFVTALKSHLAANDALRRALLVHVLFTSTEDMPAWWRQDQLQRRGIDFAGRMDDIVYCLEFLATADNEDPARREMWLRLMQLGMMPDGLAPEVRAAGLAFARDHAELMGHLYQIENPDKSWWELAREKGEAEKIRQRDAKFAKERRHYADNRDKLRRGDLALILKPARAYLGLLSDLDSDLDSNLAPEEIISSWLGADLRDDVLVGLEAVLTRGDLPSSGEVSRGFAEEKIYNYGYAIHAGIIARVRAKRPLDDLSPDVLTVGLLFAYDYSIIPQDRDRAIVQDNLAMVLSASPEQRIAVARLWIEPQFQAASDHVIGLQTLLHDAALQEAAIPLAVEWLRCFPTMPRVNEIEIVDGLTQAGRLDALAKVAAERLAGGFQNDDHRLDWLAVGALSCFDQVLPDLQGIARRDPDFLWRLRNRFRIDQGDRILPQARWIVSEFRQAWPNTPRPGGTWSGDENPHDASDFLLSMINHLAAGTDAVAAEALEALEALDALTQAPKDSYGNHPTSGRGTAPQDVREE